MMRADFDEHLIRIRPLGIDFRPSGVDIFRQISKEFFFFLKIILTSWSNPDPFFSGGQTESVFLKIKRACSQPSNHTKFDLIVFAVKL